MSEELLEKEKKILKLHLIYWAVIFALLSVFLLCVAPGRVNESAFENFSFASTIVSIVLAVVSIVFSFRTKSTTSDNIAGIREIERNIDSKLYKFDTLEENICKDVKSAITEGVGKAILELREDVGNLKEDQADIKQNLTQIALEQKKYFEPETTSSEQEINSGKKIVFKSGLSFVGKVAMYMAGLSVKKNKDLSFSALGNTINSDKDYYWGFYTALASCYPDYFDYKYEHPDLFKITKFDAEYLGGIDSWEDAVKSYDNKQTVDQYIKILQDYFGKTETEASNTTT